MGNTLYASRSVQIISVLLVISLFLLMQPQRTDAARLSGQALKRLCDRQAALGDRLPRALIDPALCEETPPPTKPTLTFSADPSSIDAGESSTLEWSTTNATSCTASDGWSGTKATSGEASVSPDETTTYTLTCTGSGGDVTKSVTVTVDEAPTPTPTLDFSANPLSIPAGGTSTLSWDSENATLCIASDGWSGEKSLDGTAQVSPSATTTYTLSCGNGVSTSTESVTVNVTVSPAPTPIPTVTLTADPTTVTENSAGNATTTLTWTSTDATSCTAFGGWTGDKPLSGSAIVQPSATTTYQLDCTGPGGVGSDDAVVNFVPAPVQSIGHVVISEVLYNATAPESDNEWIELYNGTDTAVDLEGWDIGDTNATSTISGVSIAAGGYVIIAATTTLAGIPEGVPVFVVDDIGNDLANGDDAAILYDASGAVVDQVAWGTEDVVTPVVAPLAGDGESIARTQLTSDTDTAADWGVLASPTPGQ